MRIRLFSKKDMKECLELLCKYYYVDNKKWKLEMAEKYILMHYSLNKDLCFVAVDKNKIIGIGLCMLIPNQDRYIITSHMLVVHPEYRRKKIASKLLCKILLKASQKYGVEEIEFNINSLSNFPISWYESIGFREKKHYSIIKGNISKILKSF